MSTTYQSIRKEMQRLAKNRRNAAGRPHKDPEVAEFNQQMRLFAEALNRLPPFERKKWYEQVKLTNGELIEIAKRYANQRRIYSRRQSALGWKLPQELAIQNEKSITTKLERIQAIEKLINQSHTLGVKPTTRVIRQGLRKEFPHLAEIKDDTIRKLIAIAKKTGSALSSY